MSFKAFANSWNRLINKQNSSRLENAVEHWCNELGLDESEKSCIRGNIHDWTCNQSIIKIAMGVASQFGFLISRKVFLGTETRYMDDLAPEEFSQYIGDKQEAMERQNSVDAVMLIAFVLVSVGFLINYLDKDSQQKEQGWNNSSANKYTVASSNQENILVLVINADRFDLINSLEEKNRITETDWEELYNATQFLWIGTTSEFSNSDISSYFSRSNTVSLDTSEYDVYFIRIDLLKPDPGFQPSVLQIDRRDAFQRLPETSRKSSISPRLSSEAYSGKGFYNR